MKGINIITVKKKKTLFEVNTFDVSSNRKVRPCSVEFKKKKKSLLFNMTETKAGRPHFNASNKSLSFFFVLFLHEKITQVIN